eukprot:626145-Rhodomonas_salina.4
MSGTDTVYAAHSSTVLSSYAMSGTDLVCCYQREIIRVWRGHAPGVCLRVVAYAPASIILCHCPKCLSTSLSQSDLCAYAYPCATVPYPPLPYPYVFMPTSILPLHLRISSSRVLHSLGVSSDAPTRTMGQRPVLMWRMLLPGAYRPRVHSQLGYRRDSGRRQVTCPSPDAAKSNTIRL